MDTWGGRNSKAFSFIKKKTSFAGMPEWQTNIIEETNSTKCGGFEDNFSELSEMEVIFKSGLTDQEFKTVSVTAEEDDIWSSVGLFPEPMFGKKKEKEKEINEERDYINIPVGKKKCNIKGSAMNDKNNKNKDIILPPPIPKRKNKQPKLNSEHIYEEIPFEDDKELTDVSEYAFESSMEIINNEDIYELYGVDEVTHQEKTPKSSTSDNVEGLYAVVNKRAKNFAGNSTYKPTTNQIDCNLSVTNENADGCIQTANRNSCNNIEYSVHLYSDLSSSTEINQGNSEVKSDNESHDYEENLYDLIPVNWKETFKSNSSEHNKFDVSRQEELPKNTKSLLYSGSTNRPCSVKKPKKIQTEGKHFSRVGLESKSKLSVWYVEDCVDADPIKETENTSALPTKHYRQETDSTVAIVTKNMANEESNIIILGAEVETSQCISKQPIIDKEQTVQPNHPNDSHTNTLIDFDLMEESSNFSIKNHLREDICKDDLVQQYCDSLSDALSTEDIGNEHLTIEQGMKLSSTAESGLGSSDGDALSDRASCDGHDAKIEDNNFKNINLLEMEMSLTNTETSGYETPLSPLSPSSVDLNVGQQIDCAFNKPGIVKQSSQEEAEQRRLENDEKRKNFFGNDSVDESSIFEPKFSDAAIVTNKSPSVSVLPKLNDSFPRQHQYSTCTSTPNYDVQRVRASTDSELLQENSCKETVPRDRSLTESEIEDLKKAHAAAAEKKSSKFMKQLYYGINTPDENCEVDENGKPLYEYEVERRQLIGSMKMKKQKRASWINDENNSNKPTTVTENDLKSTKLFQDEGEDSCVSNNTEIECTDNKASQDLKETCDNKKEESVKPISVQERMELLNLNKESTNGFKNKGKFNRTPVKKKSSPVSSPVDANNKNADVNDREKSEKQGTKKAENNLNVKHIMQENDRNEQDVDDMKLNMKAARSMFESKISKHNSEGLKRRQTTPTGETKNVAVFQSRLSLRKNDSSNHENRMREKILADISTDDMDVKIIEKNDSNLMVTDFEDIVDSGDTYMSYDVTETSKQEKIKSETIVEREIRLQREREEEFSRNGLSKLKKALPQEKEKRQSIAEELEKEQEIIKAHETLIEREIREQKERENVILRERKRLVGEKDNTSRDCSPSSTDRAKPLVDDSSRIMIYGLGMSSNGMPEVKVQRFSGTDEQWSRIKTAPYSSYKEYQKLLRGQVSKDDAASNQTNNAAEQCKQEITPTRKTSSLRVPSSGKSPASLSYIHKAPDDDSFSLDVVPDVIIRDKEVKTPKNRTPIRKESTIERDIRLAQQREEELHLQNKKTKESELKDQNHTVTDNPVTPSKRTAAKTYSSSSTCSNASSISRTSSVGRNLAMSTMQKEIENEKQKEEELRKQGIIKNLTKTEDFQEQKDEKKKVQVKESIIQQEIRIQKEREEALKKEHDRLKLRPNSSYQSEIKQPEADAEAAKRRSVPVADNLTELKKRNETTGCSVKRKSKLAMQWEERLQKQ